MDGRRTDQLLHDWETVADHARRPSSAPRPSLLRTMAPLAGGVAAATVIAVVAGVLWISQPRVPTGGGSSPSPSGTTLPSPSATVPPSVGPSTPGPSGDALGPFSCSLPLIGAGSAAGPSQAEATAVRVGTHDGYDRIVFEYASAVAPSLSIDAAVPPFTHDPSGLPLSVAGSSYLRIRLEGVGMGYVGPTDFPASYPQLVELARQGDYEGVQTWIAGLERSTCVRIFELSGPTRLVIDLQQ